MSGDRIRILHNTIEIFESNGERLRALAKANLARWAASRSLPEEPAKLIVREADWGDVAQELTKAYGKCFACINMANAQQPGGGYKRGAASQEENMARRTDLHFRLIDPTVVQNGFFSFGQRYTKEMEDLINGKEGKVFLDLNPLTCIKARENYTNGTVEGYELLTDDDFFPFYELRSAAVNQKFRKLQADKLREAMAARIAAQLDTLIAANVRHVVFSAFGCGAFRNDPTVVAALYKNALEARPGAFSVVAFAIFYAGHGESNYSVFADTLKDTKL